ncbi:MAG: hypothetical protein HOI70_03820 [Opitutae bacterium]|jgi:hypothetical protein|nr:hypothetical protein [Opitutae bacterium]
MIQKHILLATFRVVAFIKGDCVELPRFPRVCFFGSLMGGVNLNGESVISDVLWCG